MNDSPAGPTSAAAVALLVVVVLCQLQTWHSRYPLKEASSSDVEVGGRSRHLQLHALLASQWGFAWCTVGRVEKFS